MKKQDAKGVLTWLIIIWPLLSSSTHADISLGSDRNHYKPQFSQLGSSICETCIKDDNRPLNSGYSLGSHGYKNIKESIRSLLLLTAWDWESAKAIKVNKERLADILTATSYDDCKAKLVNAGWCKIESGKPTAHMNSVYPDVYTAQGWLGNPRNIIEAWGDLAFDKVDKFLYFWGGGHGDYAGNEVYKFALNTGEWSRLTNPSPLDFIAYDWGSTDKYIKIPDVRIVPAAAHSYGGMVYNHVTKKIIMVSRAAANGVKAGGGSDTDSNFISNGERSTQWEFDPVLAESLGQAKGHQAFRNIGRFGHSYPRTFMVSDRVMFGDKSSLYNIDFNVDGKIAAYNKFQSQADWSEGNAEYDAIRSLIWTNHDKQMFGYTLTGATSFQTKPPILGKSMAFDSQNNIVLWDGCSKVATYTPESDTWLVDDWLDKGMGTCVTGVGRVYGKWVNIEGNYFVGVASPRSGVWVYKAGRAPKNVVTTVYSRPINEIVSTTPLVEQVLLPSEQGLTLLYEQGFEDETWHDGWLKSVSKSRPVKVRDVDLYASTIVSENCANGNCLRVDVKALKCCGVAIHYPITGNNESIVAEYKLRFADNFSPRIYNGTTGALVGAGGKLPGLADVRVYPEPQCGNGGASSDGINCWSARLMFRGCWKASCYESSKVRIGGYMYTPDTASGHGDLAAFDADTWGVDVGFRHGIGRLGQLDIGRWYTIRVQVTMNDVGVKNGIYRAWIDGELAYDKTDLTYRYEGHDNLYVATFWLNHMFGGSNVGPKVDTHILIDDLRIYKAD